MSSDPEDLGRVQRAIDRLEERFIDAPDGMHRLGRPAQPAALERASLPAAAALLWAKYDGLELAHGEARLYAVVELLPASRTAEAEGLLREGDLVIGERGRSLIVLPADPWEEGADVVSVDDEAQRAPEASSVAHLILGWLGEISVLYTDDGEFQDDIIDEYGELIPAANRRLLRRRLDFDPDAPRPRLDLARSLRESGELRAAKSELGAVLKRAPEYAWARHELGRVLCELDQREPGYAAHERAGLAEREPELQAWFWAWAAAAAPDEIRRKASAQRVLDLRPEFAANQAAGARARLARGDEDEAAEMMMLGLAVAPKNLDLLALKKRTGH